VYRGDEVAAKVYKDRQQRSFKNDAAYREGRTVRNTRTQRAMDRGSRYGRGEAEEAWKVSESRCLHKLHALGIRVPTPVLFYEGVLLMQLVTDADGYPAPRLLDATLRREDAAELYRDLRRQVIGMLCAELIHGDLSAYNVLLGAEGPTIIDFPQTLEAAHNSRAEAFFRRDFDGLQRFFARLDPALEAHHNDGREVWRAYVRRELSPEFVPRAGARPPRPLQPPWGPPLGPAARPEGSRPRPGGPREGAPPPGAVRAPQTTPGTAFARQAPGKHGPARAPEVSYLRRSGHREGPPKTPQEAPGAPGAAPQRASQAPSGATGEVADGRRRHDLERGRR
jgi:RIO kinase 1